MMNNCNFIRLGLLLLCAIGYNLAFAQNTCHIYKFEFTFNKRGTSISQAQLYTAFNPSKYNNQPSFIDNNNVLFSSDFQCDTNVNDIYKFDINNTTIERFTNTKGISEYSPTYFEKHVYTVRIEKDGKTQSLWKYPFDKSNSGKRIFTDYSNIGYFTFLNSEEVAMFLVEDPISLAIGNIRTGIVERILSDIGRCMKVDASGNLYITQKISDSDWRLKKYFINKNQLEVITSLKSQDFELLPDGSIVTTDGSKLILYDQVKGEWNVIGELMEYGIAKPTRIAINKNILLIVANQ